MTPAAGYDIHVAWTGVEKVFCGQLCSWLYISCCVRIGCVKVAARPKCGALTVLLFSLLSRIAFQEPYTNKRHDLKKKKESRDSEERF